MPDYQRAVRRARRADIADKLDTLVISTPRPRDVTATTLVVHTHAVARRAARLPREHRRADHVVGDEGRPARQAQRQAVPERQARAPVAVEGLVRARAARRPRRADRRGRRQPRHDRGEGASCRRGSPAIRTIENESGDDKRGPALVLTLAGAGQARTTIPDCRPRHHVAARRRRGSRSRWSSSSRAGSCAATSCSRARPTPPSSCSTLTDVADSAITDSRILLGVLKQQHALNVITGLSLARTGARVSYATSISIADARAILAARRSDRSTATSATDRAERVHACRVRLALAPCVTCALAACGGVAAQQAARAGAATSTDEGAGVLARASTTPDDEASPTTRAVRSARAVRRLRRYGGDRYGGDPYGGDAYGGATLRELTRAAVELPTPNRTPHYRSPPASRASIEGTVTWRGPLPRRSTSPCGAIDNPRSASAATRRSRGVIVYIEKVTIGRVMPNYCRPAIVGGVLAKHGCALAPAAQIVEPLPALAHDPRRCARARGSASRRRGAAKVVRAPGRRPSRWRARAASPGSTARTASSAPRGSSASTRRTSRSPTTPAASGSTSSRPAPTTSRSGSRRSPRRRRRASSSTARRSSCIAPSRSTPAKTAPAFDVSLGK